MSLVRVAHPPPALAPCDDHDTLLGYVERLRQKEVGCSTINFARCIRGDDGQMTPHCDCAQPRCCSQCARPVKQLLHCSRCRVMCYCSDACQRTHWRAEHRRMCAAMQRSRSALDSLEHDARALLHRVFLGDDATEPHRLQHRTLAAARQRLRLSWLASAYWASHAYGRGALLVVFDGTTSFDATFDDPDRLFLPAQHRLYYMDERFLARTYLAGNELVKLTRTYNPLTDVVMCLELALGGVASRVISLLARTTPSSRVTKRTFVRAVAREPLDVQLPPLARYSTSERERRVIARRVRTTLRAMGLTRQAVPHACNDEPASYALSTDRLDVDALAEHYREFVQHGTSTMLEFAANARHRASVGATLDHLISHESDSE